MFKLCVIATLIAFASAGVISLDEGLGGYGGYASLGGLGGYGLGGIAVGHKVIAAPTIAVKAGATSYQNSNLISLHPTPVVTKAIAAPIAAPIVTKIAAPVGVIGVHGLGGYGGLGLSGLGGYGGLALH
ncbi:cuticle protein 65-like [Anthonomus grandis grandis]|uniref:cuticle protein 65-like n=1 Tax=Anthonomus grandis grandis TaxID=2921223 RepID=UPI0021657EFF|nr:cuticle protein 65-like [Anthonomus grandis grandis]